jgi:ABC-type amino acid transport substrate-binding protein
LNDVFPILSVSLTRLYPQPTTETGFTFSTPYLYDGLGFGGMPEFLDCAENRNITGAICEELRVCVVDGTTQTSIVRKHFAPISISDRIISVRNVAGVYEGLKSGFCNVIANDQISIAPSTLFENGYSGPYEVGTNIYSNEPISLVTRETDPRFSDFVNWVVISLVHAEERNVRATTATAMGSNDIFGARYELSFVEAVRAVGNYGEVYDRNLESIVPRQDLNNINRGGSGLIYHMPFGDVLSIGPSAQGTLAEILDRGFLRCGITRRAIFAEFDTTLERWHGIDIDMCRAMSAAIFDGIYSTIVFVDLPATERFQALKNGDVDLLSRITTLTLQRDVQEPTTGVGFEFTSPIFYDGLTFGGIPE